MPDQPQEEPQKKPEENEESLRKLSQGVNSYAKYMSAGIQLVAPVIVGALVGYWIDSSQHNEKPVWTIILSSIMIVVALYLFLRQFLKN